MDCMVHVVAESRTRQSDFYFCCYSKVLQAEWLKMTETYPHHSANQKSKIEVLLVVPCFLQRLKGRCLSCLFLASGGCQQSLVFLGL